MNMTVQVAGVDEILLQKLRSNAVREEQGERIAESLALLRQADLLNDAGSISPQRTARFLMRIAGANLSVARLLEGHINALRLIEIHGSPELLSDVRRKVRDGALLGVWGADGTPPLSLDTTSRLLEGCKTYASGLGSVTHAVVTVDVASGVQLCLVDVQEAARQMPDTWTMSGMRATRSGDFDFTGIEMDHSMCVGAPDVYLCEPGFIGGVWRTAALQLGAAAGLLDVAARQLRQMDRFGAEAQIARLTNVAIRVLGGERLVARAAEFAEHDAGRKAPESAVALSGSARLLSEEIGLQAIAAVEQSLGLSHFERDSESGRIARDLAVYMRQAGRDALLTRVGKQLLGTDSIWEFLP